MPILQIKILRLRAKTYPISHGCSIPKQGESRVNIPSGSRLADDKSLSQLGPWSEVLCLHLLRTPNIPQIAESLHLALAFCQGLCQTSAGFLKLVLSIGNLFSTRGCFLSADSPHAAHADSPQLEPSSVMPAHPSLPKKHIFFSLGLML